MHSVRKQANAPGRPEKKQLVKAVRIYYKYNKVSGRNRDLSVHSILPAILNTSSILADVAGIARYFLWTWDRIGNSEDFQAQ